MIRSSGLAMYKYKLYLSALLHRGSSVNLNYIAIGKHSSGARGDVVMVPVPFVVSPPSDDTFYLIMAWGQIVQQTSRPMKLSKC